MTPLHGNALEGYFSQVYIACMSQISSNLLPPHGFLSMLLAVNFQSQCKASY